MTVYGTLAYNVKVSIADGTTNTVVSGLDDGGYAAGIIERIDLILKKKNMTQRDLAKRLGKSEAVVSRWTTGFPNLTLRSIAHLSEALGEPLIQIPR